MHPFMLPSVARRYTLYMQSYLHNAIFILVLVMLRGGRELHVFFELKNSLRGVYHVTVAYKVSANLFLISPPGRLFRRPGVVQKNIEKTCSFSFRTFLPRASSLWPVTSSLNTGAVPGIILQDFTRIGMLSIISPPSFTEFGIYSSSRANIVPVVPPKQFPNESDFSFPPKSLLWKSWFPIPI